MQQSWIAFVGPSGAATPMKQVTIPFTQQFDTTPVVVVANALHDPSDHNIGDAFAVTIAFVGDNSFDANICRLDSPAKGWSQNLYLSWFATNVGGSTF
jgi:hypothetical protein